MSVTVTYNQELMLIEFVVTGYVSSEDIESANAQGLALSKANECKHFLIDCSDKREVESIFKYYEDAESGYEALGLDRRIRAAVVMPQHHEARQDTLFYETVCRNLGWQVQTFEDRETALAWLFMN